MKSTFIPTGLGYLYTLGDEYDPDLLTVEVTALRQRAGSAYALLTTSTTISNARRIPGGNRVLNAEVWLLSERSRAEYAAALKRLIPSPSGAAAIDFSAVLEDVAQQVIDAENLPVEVVLLSKTKPSAVTPYLMEWLIPMGKSTILYGPGGVGKSILAATIAVAVQTGSDWLGLKVQQAETLYLDWETDEPDIATRVRAASKGLGLTTTAELRYSALVRPIEDRVAQLARYVAEEGIGFVVIDSVGMAMSAARDGGDASETAIRFFRALRALKCAVLAIDHVAGEDMRRRSGAPKPYGSVYKWNSARNAFELREHREPDTKGNHLVLKHRKSNLGPRSADIHMLMNWVGDSATFEYEKVLPHTDVPLHHRIADLLVVAPATPHQISDMLSDSETPVYEMDVRRELKVMLSEGKITVMADGTIRLAPLEAPVVDSPLIPD